MGSNALWRLDDARQSLVLASRDTRLPEVIYWGARLPDHENLTALAAAVRPDVTGGMLDTPPPISICPDELSFPGEAGLVVRDAAGRRLCPRFTLTDTAHDDRRIAFTARDEAEGLTYRASFTIDAETHIITAQAALEADAPVALSWLAAPVLPAPQASDDTIEVSGRWCGEFQLARHPWGPGARQRNNPTGRTGHEHFPGLLIPARGTTNTAGEAYALHYGWSGGHRMVTEELPDGRRQIQFGHARDSEREPGTRFETGPLFATYAGSGLNGCAVAFQRHVRDRVVNARGALTRRPVHYNCWEAVYFEHDLADLKTIATRAADLGAERFVLDDGWFRGRTDDRRALGDWTIDGEKYPGGLAPLIDHVHALGMSFGLWFEPEMVNPDSDLHRAHPAWVLGPGDQPLGRHQLVLNMAREDVRNALYDQVAALLGAHPIEYVKWDHNRVLPFADAAQARGVYALFDRLGAAFPDVEFETCASGGGRIDFAILSRTQRVWLSDSNDALERLRMQHDAALFLPMTVTGSHVGPERSHTSGRTLSMAFRAWVAAQRQMGFEMDPRDLSDADAATLRTVTAWWKANRAFLAKADILRLESADAAVIAEQHLGRDGARFIVFAGKARTSRQILPRPLRLTGLDRAARYRVDLLNRADVPALSRGDPALARGPVELSGAALMHHGITLPWSMPETMVVLDGQRIAS